MPYREGRPGRLRAAESARITRRITAFSVGVGIVLITLKLIVFRESGSVGILSSLVHSSLDLIAALSSFFAVRYAARAARRYLQIWTRQGGRFLRCFTSLPHHTCRCAPA